MEKKTNVMRLLERAGVAYEPVYYDLGEEEFSGEAVAQLLGVAPQRMYKTLTARGTKRGVLVYMVPAGATLNPGRAAKAAGDKKVELLPVKELPAVTGYHRGEVSPLGMKKVYPVYIHEDALRQESIIVSAGRKGASVAVQASALAALVGAQFAQLTDEENQDMLTLL